MNVGKGVERDNRGYFLEVGTEIKGLWAEGNCGREVPMGQFCHMPYCMVRVEADHGLCDRHYQQHIESEIIIPSIEWRHSKMCEKGLCSSYKQIEGYCSYHKTQWMRRKARWDGVRRFLGLATKKSNGQAEGSKPRSPQELGLYD